MEEIKFRLWNPERKVITAGNYLNVILMTTDVDFVNEFDRKKMVWMQYVGINDCNEKEIYEGDILSMDVLVAESGTVIDNEMEEQPTFLVKPKNDYELGVVKFLDGGFWVVFKTDEGEEAMCMIDSSMEIIGNIYKDSELI
jgi:uncharacterized phage protein (TIGR01671 family)